MLSILTKQELSVLLAVRPGEIKSGEVVQLFTDPSGWERELRNRDGVRYVMVGIPEDIGPRANMGSAGCSTMWNAFLQKIVNVQSNKFFDWSKVLIAGNIDVTDLMEEAEGLDPANEQDLLRLRGLVSLLDERVVNFTKEIISAGKIPVVIGGGHNNSYGLLKGSSLALNRPVNCLNIDPHADLRRAEGRHSGNGFTYALQENHLSKYAVAGLHENYNSSYIMDQFGRNDNLFFVTYEQILDKEAADPGKIINFMGTDACGFEVDLDSIRAFPSSASTPSGFAIDEMRQMIRYNAQRLNIIYIHFAEGSATGESAGLWAKGLCYLVTDFLKSYESSGFRS